MPRKRKQLDFDEVVRILRTNYDYAVLQDWIRKPLSWALYKTWRGVECREPSRGQNDDATED